MQGERKPKGSKSLADWDKNDLFVISPSNLKFILKMNLSFLESQIRPNAFEQFSGWISKFGSLNSRFLDIFVKTSRELERHFLRWNPRASKASIKAWIKMIASLVDDAPDIKSSI
ncbi:hypothetical protein TNCV_508961 [Trichonephila clavipes]|nr:hypothetical protein TNCV_508961 [Trichonephila clavipes]